MLLLLLLMLSRPGCWPPTLSRGNFAKFQLSPEIHLCLLFNFLSFQCQEVEDVIYVTELSGQAAPSALCVLFISVFNFFFLVFFLECHPSPLLSAFSLLFFISGTWNVEWVLNTRSLSTQVESAGQLRESGNANGGAVVVASPPTL